MRTVSGLLLFVLVAAPIASADEAKAPTFAQIKPALERYCVSCHSGEKPKGNFRMDTLLTDAKPGVQWQKWGRIGEAVHDKEMPPPATKLQPTAAERKLIADFGADMLAKAAAARAGDPGDVVVRQWTRRQYRNIVMRVTDDMVDTATWLSLPEDRAGGEGFSNVGSVQSLTEQTLKNYLEHAKRLSSHLRFGADGSLFFTPSPSKEGSADGETERLNRFVMRYAFRLYPYEPITIGWNLPFADYFYVCWQHRHHKALGLPDDLQAIGASHQMRVAPWYGHGAGQDYLVTSPSGPMSPRLLAYVHSLLHEPEKYPPAYELDILRASINALPGPDAKPLSATNGKLSTKMRGIYEKDWLLQVHEKVGAPDRVKVERQVWLRCFALGDWLTHKAIRFLPSASLGTGHTQNQNERIGLVAKSIAGSNQKLRIDGSILLKGEKQPRPLWDWINDNHPMAYRGLAGEWIDVQEGKEKKTMRLMPLPLRIAFEVPQSSVVTFHAALHDGKGVIALHVSPEFDTLDEELPHNRTFLADESTLKSWQAAATLLPRLPHSNGTTFDRPDFRFGELMLGEAERLELAKRLRELSDARAVASFEDFIANQDRAAQGDSAQKFDKNIDRTRLPGLEVDLEKAIALTPEKLRPRYKALRGDYQRVMNELTRPETQAAHLESAIQITARAWQRPLAKAEQDALREQYRNWREKFKQTHEEAIRTLIARAFSSPKFLLRFEPAADVAGIHDVEPRTLADRLALFLTDAPADDRLLRLADEGHLKNAATLRQEATRLLKSSASIGMVDAFFGEWLAFNDFSEYNTPDSGFYRVYNLYLSWAMQEEMRRHCLALLQKDRPIEELLSSDRLVLDVSLAEHYGLVEKTSSRRQRLMMEFAEIPAPNSLRGGLIPSAFMATYNSSARRPSPVKRGHYILKNVLGVHLPPPPPNVPQLPMEDNPKAPESLIEMLAAHRRDAACANCHAKFDHFGLALENLDGIGRWRETDAAGRPVVAKVDFPDGATVGGPTQLAKYITDRRRQDFRRSFCSNLLAYGLGRAVEPQDEPLIKTMTQSLETNNGRVTAAILTVIESSQFRTRRGRNFTLP